MPILLAPPWTPEGTINNRYDQNQNSDTQKRLAFSNSKRVYQKQSDVLSEGNGDFPISDLKTAVFLYARSRMKFGK